MIANKTSAYRQTNVSLEAFRLSHLKRNCTIVLFYSVVMQPTVLYMYGVWRLFQKIMQLFCQSNRTPTIDEDSRVTNPHDQWCPNRVFIYKKSICRTSKLVIQNEENDTIIVTNRNKYDISKSYICVYKS